MVSRLAANGIGTSVHFIPVHQLSGYAALLGPDEVAAVPVTDRVADQLLSLPLYPDLSDADLDLTAKTLLEAVR